MSKITENFKEAVYTTLNSMIALQKRLGELLENMPEEMSEEDAEEMIERMTIKVMKATSKQNDFIHDMKKQGLI